MYYAVIMAGGSGTRLWPLSRQTHPKQALALVGDKTMFQYSVDRIRPIFPIDRILVITRSEHASILMEQVPDLPVENFILEPEGRGTAPAIGLAAIHLRRRDPDAIMAVLTADHFIPQAEKFCNVLSAAEQVSSNGFLVTLGISPTSPSTGFGYIRQGARLGEVKGFPYFAVDRFIEKPDPSTAEMMVTSGGYVWNGGMFICQVERMLQEFSRQMPDFYSLLMKVNDSLGTPDFQTVLGSIWPQVAKQTIDYGVMESARQVAVIPVDLGWLDVGSWESLFDLHSTRADENILVGNYLDIDTTGTLIFGKNRLVATLGVKNLIIVDTDDALLVCSREHAQNVKIIVETLMETGRGSLV